jgi:hypothetical protein
MFDNSVIKRTGQWWKLVVAFCTMLLGGAAIVIAFSTLGNKKTPEGFSLLMLTGVVVGLFGGFLGVLVRCPNCHTHWVWSALKGQNAGGWLAWLLSQRNCPACQFPDVVSQPR